MEVKSWIRKSSLRSKKSGNKWVSVSSKSEKILVKPKVVKNEWVSVSSNSEKILVKRRQVKIFLDETKTVTLTFRTPKKGTQDPSGRRGQPLQDREPLPGAQDEESRRKPAGANSHKVG